MQDFPENIAETGREYTPGTGKRRARRRAVWAIFSYSTVSRERVYPNMLSRGVSTAWKPASSEPSTR